MGMYIVYILKSENYNKTYVGITNDLQRRLLQHNSGYHSYTKRYKPWFVIYKDILDNRIEAHIKEKYLKSAAGRRWIKRMFFI